MADTNRLLRAAQEIQIFCATRGWPFCFIEGLAVQRWGEARVTRDADLTLFTGIGDELAYADELLAHFPSRVPDGREFALKHRVVLLRATNGIPLDISFGALDFEYRAVGTASDEEIVPGFSLRLCNANALLVFKAFAGRPQDWLDIEGIAVKSAPALEWDAIRFDLAPLLELKGDSETLARLEAIVHRGSAAHKE